MNPIGIIYGACFPTKLGLEINGPLDCLQFIRARYTIKHFGRLDYSGDFHFKRIATR